MKLIEAIKETNQRRNECKQRRRQEDVNDIKNGHGVRLTKIGQGDYASGRYYNKKSGRYVTVSDNELES